MNAPPDPTSRLAQERLRRRRGVQPRRLIDWAAQPLGAEPDSAIAARLGCSHRVVAQARIRRGIPSHRATVPRVVVPFPLEILPRLTELAEQESWRARIRGAPIEREDGVQLALLAVVEACARGMKTPPREWGALARVIMRNALLMQRRRAVQGEAEAPVSA